MDVVSLCWGGSYTATPVCGDTGAAVQLPPQQCDCLPEKTMWTRFRELFSQFVRPLSEGGRAPAGLWYVIGAFVVEAIAYFGILTLMTTYLQHRTCTGRMPMPA